MIAHAGSLAQMAEGVYLALRQGCPKVEASKARLSIFQTASRNPLHTTSVKGIPKNKPLLPVIPDVVHILTSCAKVTNVRAVLNT